VKRIELWLAGILLAATVYLGIATSLALDETGTLWIVKDGFGDACSRAMWWSATSPLYYGVLWVFVQILGLGEITLRAPSVFFSAGTAVVLYHLARRWLDAEGAALSVLFFFCLPPVQYSVIDARPYALGLLLLTCAWLSLMRWLENDRWGDGLLFVLSAAGVVWAHYTVAIGLAPLAWYVPRLGWRRTAAAALVLILLVAPLALQVMETMDRRNELSWSSPPGVFETVFTLVPGHVVALLVMGAVLATVFAKKGADDFSPYDSSSSLAPLLLSAAAPVVLLYIASKADVIQLFEPRYLLSKQIGAAVLAAWLIRGLASQKARRATAIGAFALVIPWNAAFTPRHGNEKWRESSEWVVEEVARHKDTRVVLVSAFIESMQDGHLNNPAYRDILLAPQTAYPVPGSPLLLPWWPNDEAKRRLKEEVEPAARDSGRLLVVCPSMGIQYKDLMARSLSDAGLALTEEKRFGHVVGLVYERPVTLGQRNGG